MGCRELRVGFGKFSPETRVTERRNLGLSCPLRSQSDWAGTEPGKKIAGKRGAGAPPEAPAPLLAPLLDLGTRPLLSNRVVILRVGCVL